MEYIYTPVRSNRKIEYIIQEPNIQVYLDGALQMMYDLTKPEENEFIQQDGDTVTLLRFYTFEEKHLFETP